MLSNHMIQRDIQFIAMRKKGREARKFKLGISKLKFIVAYKYGTSGILIWMANFRLKVLL